MFTGGPGRHRAEGHTQPAHLGNNSTRRPGHRGGHSAVRKQGPHLSQEGLVNASWEKGLINRRQAWDAWVAQSVERLTSAQVMISRFMSLSPASGFVLTARSLEPASHSVSPSLSDLPRSRSLSVSKINIKTKMF